MGWLVTLAEIAAILNGGSAQAGAPSRRARTSSTSPLISMTVAKPASNAAMQHRLQALRWKGVRAGRDAFTPQRVSAALGFEGGGPPPGARPARNSKRRWIWPTVPSATL
jgi:hypothetical protein